MLRIGRPVTFLLPFDQYRLTVSHRLLDNMGGVSRFLLRAVGEGLSLAALTEVTGLSEATLQNQLMFLQNHQYLYMTEEVDPEPQLTPKGVRVVQVERLLKDFEPEIWLDSFTLASTAAHLLLLGESAADVMRAAAADVTGQTARMPCRPAKAGRSLLFYEANRLRSLLDQDGLKTLLAHYWGDDCEFIASEYPHWSVKLNAPENERSQVHFPVEYAAGDLILRLHTGGGATRKPELPWVSVPVLELAYVFKQVTEFPWPVTVPPPVTQHLELVTCGPLDEFAEHAMVNGGNHVVIPACLGENPPNTIATFPVPLGVSTEVSARNLQLKYSMDERQLGRLMRSCPDTLVLSVPVEEEQPA
jgi:hypothetical protein